MATRQTASHRAVAISAGNLAPGGVETHVQILAALLRSLDCTVTVYGTGCHWSAETLDALRGAGVQFRIPPPLVRSMRKAAVAWSVIQWRKFPPTRVRSLYGIGTGKSHEQLKRIAGAGTFGIYHEIVSPAGKQSPTAMSMEFMDAAIANSRRVADQLVALCSCKPVRVIPFLTAEADMEPPKTRRPVNGRALHVGYLGRLEPRKRPDLLVRQWGEMTSKSSLAGAVLHLHGDDDRGGMRARIDSYVAEHSLADRIKVHGSYSHSNLHEILSRLDIVVLPSAWEGLPLVLVEAMQHGVPVVATNSGGTAELAQDNPAAIITENEWSAFEDGLVKMASRLREGKVDPIRLHQWVENRYGFHAVSKQWEAALLEPRAFFEVPTDVSR